MYVYTPEIMSETQVFRIFTLKMQHFSLSPGSIFVPFYLFILWTVCIYVGIFTMEHVWHFKLPVLVTGTFTCWAISVTHHKSLSNNLIENTVSNDSSSLSLFSVKELNKMYGWNEPTNMIVWHVPQSAVIPLLMLSF